MRSACCSQKRIKNASLVKVWPTFTMILSWVTTTGCALTLLAHLSKKGSFTFLFHNKCQSGTFCVYKTNLSLRLILDARHLPNSQWQLGLGVQMRMKRRISSHGYFRMASRIRHDEEARSGRLCLRGAKVVLLRHSRCPCFFPLEHVLLPACWLPAGEVC